MSNNMREQADRVIARCRDLAQFSEEPGQIKRTFAELVEYLFRSQVFPQGVLLLTGTGIVPPDTFTLQPDDKIRITISGIGALENSVVVVDHR